MDISSILSLLGGSHLFKNVLLYIKAILLPHPHLLNTPFHDPQTVRDAVETGHEEPEAPAEGNAAGIEDSIAKKGSSATHCVPVCCRTPLWRPCLWFQSRNPYIFVIGSVSATVKPPPNRPLLHLTRQEKQLITPRTSPGKTHLRLIKLQASHQHFNDLLNSFRLDKQS